MTGTATKFFYRFEAKNLTAPNTGLVPGLETKTGRNHAAGDTVEHPLPDMPCKSNS